MIENDFIKYLKLKQKFIQMQIERWNSSLENQPFLYRHPHDAAIAHAAISILHEESKFNEKFLKEYETKIESSQTVPGV